MDTGRLEHKPGGRPGRIRDRPSRAPLPPTMWMMLTALIGLLAFSGWCVQRELVVVKLQRLAQATTIGDAEANDLATWLGMCAPLCPARALAAGAATTLRLAASASGAPRQLLLDRAQRLARSALEREPVSADNWARLALVQYERSGERVTAEVARNLHLSYGSAPFSREAAAWRIAFCLQHWDGIDRGLRTSALDELDWIARIDPSLAADLRGLPIPPAAQLAMDLRTP